MVGGTKLNLVSMDQMTNEYIMSWFNWSNSNEIMEKIGKMASPKSHS
jgi:hypothetical protein